MMKKFGLLLIVLLLPLSPVYPQSDAKYSPITPDNVHQLTEIARMGHGLINDMEWSPDGQWLAVATSNGVFVYDTGDWKQEPLTLPGYDVAVSDLDWQPKNSRLVTIDIGAELRLWEIENGSPRERDVNLLPESIAPENYSFGGGNKYQVVYEEDGKILIVARCDGELCLWDATSSSVVDPAEYSVVRDRYAAILDYHGERLHDRNYSYSDNLAVERSCYPDQTRVCQMIVRDKETFEELDTIILGDVEIYGIGGVAATDDFIAASVSTRDWEKPLEEVELRIIPLYGSEEIAFEMDVAGVFLSEVEISPNGQQVVARTVSNIHIWDVDERQKVAILGGFGNGATEVVFHPSGDYLIAFHDQRSSSYPYGENITFWEMESWQHIHSMPAIGGFTLSPDGNTLYMSNYSFVGAQILPTLWDISDLASPVQLETPAYFDDEMIYLPFSDFAFFEEEGILAGAHNGGPSLVLWDIESGEVLKNDACDGLACQFIISADGSLIVMTVSDYQQFVERDDFLSEEYLNETGTWIMGYWTAISPTVEQIAVNTDFRTVTIYNRDFTERYQFIPQDIDNIFTLTYSHDGALLAVALCVENVNLLPCKEARIRFYETQGFKVMHEIQAMDTYISSLTFSPNGEYLFVGYGGSERVIDSLTDAKYIGVYAVGE